MLRITADIFSGRPNPAWEVGDEAEVRAMLRELTADPSLLTDDTPAESGLGLRGFRLEVHTDELAQDFRVGSPVYLPVGPQARGARASELAERVINLIGRGEESTVEGAPPLDTSATELLTTQLEAVTRQSRSVGTGTDRATPPTPDETVDAAAVCTYEFSAFNPGFWNNDATVRRCNNCYNYASNWRTNTFAQPGLGCGSVWTTITCAEITRAALCDGMHRRYDCFPDSEYPRYLLAMVVAPPPAFGNGDYHWYRYQLEGYWGHKPGGTAARNTDDSGAVIYNPETANRGPYTQFCGYFYGCNSQRQRIRGFGC
jgi:hypothetical protein